ncbi:TORTIFOLIA1-like protein 4 [Salvia miltiorrhiza]|uniref:TORTIFOLIA1-like protein 4 n=1 Tax=Salvia miltiorrhiza TaxID=226208 RepID=UPI0025ACA0EB|nr:TORTIFOLIA1-like protein 4 [Salvia miltiorrhiza]
MSASNSAKQAKARDMKQRVLTCLHKLADRDTHSAAASELESIARTLPADALPSFISSVAATDASDKSPVRRQCLRLVSILSEHHGNSLSPYLSKILSAVVRRLRDADSSVRSACVAASLSLSSHVTSPPFASVIKPFVESLFTEQETNAQTGAALCLAAAIEGSRNPDAASLRRLLPRIEKLAKSESFKAKPALLALVGSLVAVDGVLRGGGRNVVWNLLNLLVDFLSSDDWAARKAAAEALVKIAAVESESLSEYKASCLKTFEAKRFDKVKAARETMNQMIEAWKEIPDLPDEFSPLPESEASSKQNASDGCYPPVSKTACSVGSNNLLARRRSPLDTPATRTPRADGSPASTARKRSPLGSNVRNTGPAMFQKLDRKKPSDLKVEIVTPAGCYGVELSDGKGDHVMETSEGEKKAFEKSGIKRALFKENNGKQHKLGFFRGGSRVVPCGDTSVVVSNETGDICRNHRECDDLSLIRTQLLQIESQQSNLMDMLQKFIGSSQKGLNSLEARVHGLELALDEISFDLAVSTGRMSQNGAAGAMCCKLPGTDFLSSKLWRKAGSRSSTSRLPAASNGNPSVFGNGQGFPMEHRRFLQGRHALVMNPLAKIPSGSPALPEVSSSGLVYNSTA